MHNVSRAGHWQNQVVEQRRETFWDGARPYHATKWHQIIYDRNSGQFLSCDNCIKVCRIERRSRICYTMIQPVGYLIFTYVMCQTNRCSK